MSNDVIDKLMRNAIGFDQLFRFTETATTGNYPPYNVEQIGENGYRVVVAAAGFSRDEVEIALEDRILTISGSKNDDKSEPGTFIHRGIAFRDFSRSFRLGEYVEVTSASMHDGLIVVDLERRVPEEQKPRLIPIT